MEAPTPDDWPRIADLVKQYGDFPFGGVDASIVVLAERLAIETVVTLDVRFGRGIERRSVCCRALSHIARRGARDLWSAELRE